MAGGDLRMQHREATRERILEAVQEVLTEEHPAALSMPRVAERAGTSLRTLYRYFPTKEALVDAASHSFTVDADHLGRPPSATNVVEFLQAMWGSFSRALPAVRAQHLAPAGRELRAVRVPRARAAVRGALQTELRGLGADDADRLVDLVVALVSSATFLELVDRLEHDPDDAARLMGWTVQSVIDRAQREGAVAR